MKVLAKSTLSNGRVKVTLDAGDSRIEWMPTESEAATITVGQDVPFVLEGNKSLALRVPLEPLPTQKLVDDGYAEIMATVSRPIRNIAVNNKELYEQEIRERVPHHFPLATLFVKPGELTGSGDGCIVQFDNVLSLLSVQWRIEDVAYIFHSLDCHGDIQRAALAGHDAIAMWKYNREELGNLKGGTIVSGYRSKYSGKIIEMFSHPLYPSGVIVFAVKPDCKVMNQLVASWQKAVRD